MDFESILNTIQPFVLMAVALFATTATAIWVAVVIWAFRDIRARTRDIFAQILATLLVFVFLPFFPLPGVILYLILRPRETLAEVYERSLEEEVLLQGIEERLACPGCNRRIEEDFMICPTCHTRLKKACPTCGRLLHLRWNICPFCGAVQTMAKVTPAISPRPVAMPVEPATEAPRLDSAPTSSLPEPAVEAAEAEPLPATEIGPEVEPEAEPGGGPSFEAETGSGPVLEAETGTEPQAETLPFEFD